MQHRILLGVGLSLALIACGDKDDDDTGGTGTDSGATDGGTTDTDGGTDSGGSGVPEVLSDCTRNDTIYLWSAAMEGDTLVVPVWYGGGCEEHQFSLCWPDQTFMESEPVQVQLYVWHEDNGDACEAEIEEELRFDMSALRSAYETSYPGGSGKITVHVDDQTVLWTL